MADDEEFDEDLARLDPRHWAEAMRRAEALRSYLALQAPTVADAELAAGGLGVGVGRLYQLARQWRLAGSLSSLVPHADRPRTPRLHPTLARIADEAIDAVLARDPDANAEDAAREVKARCTAAGLKPPSRPTVRLRFERRVAAPGARPLARTADPYRLIVDRAAVAVPVASPAGPALPLVTLAMDGATGAVAALGTTDDDEPLWRSAAHALADAIEAASSVGTPPPRRIEVDRDWSPRWRDLSDLIRRHGLELATPRLSRRVGGRHVRRLVGSALMAIPLITHGIAPSGRERYLRWRGGAAVLMEPLPPADVIRIVTAAARLHNQAIASRVPDRKRLASWSDAAIFAADLRGWAADR